MAKAFKKAIEAGREAREFGLAEKLSRPPRPVLGPDFCLNRVQGDRLEPPTRVELQYVTYPNSPQLREVP